MVQRAVVSCAALPGHVSRQHTIGECAPTYRTALSGCVAGKGAMIENGAETCAALPRCRVDGKRAIIEDAATSATTKARFVASKDAVVQSSSPGPSSLYG